MADWIFKIVCAIGATATWIALWAVMFACTFYTPEIVGQVVIGLASCGVVLSVFNLGVLTNASRPDDVFVLVSKILLAASASVWTGAVAGYFLGH